MPSYVWLLITGLTVYHSLSETCVLLQGEVKEEVDIDLTDPDTEAAAIKIQAGFKGYQTRKELQTKKQEATKTDKKPDGKTEEEVDIDLTDPDVEAAAVKIQAGFKGFKTRQELKTKQEGSTQAQGEEEDKKEGETEEEKVDIDLNDPEVAQAATKIQAGFKGYKTRQELKQKKEGGDQ